jgi:hypothetical protein
MIGSIREQNVSLTVRGGCHDEHAARRPAGREYGVLRLVAMLWHDTMVRFTV